MYENKRKVHNTYKKDKGEKRNVKQRKLSKPELL